MVHFSYSTYDAQLPECFELPVILGFEESSFKYRKNEFNNLTVFDVVCYSVNRICRV